MAGKVLNIKVCTPLKQPSGLTGKYNAICHYSYNLPLCLTLKNDTTDNKRTENERQNANASAKSKELQPNAQSQRNAAHLLLAQRTHRH